VLLRLAYLTVANTFAVLRLLPMSDRDKDVEILALRHQIGVLEWQLGDQKVRFASADRAFLAALLHRVPRQVLDRLRLLVRPDTVLRSWHRDLISRRHAATCRPKKPGRSSARTGSWTRPNTPLTPSISCASSVSRPNPPCTTSRQPTLNAARNETEFVRTRPILASKYFTPRGFPAAHVQDSANPRAFGSCTTPTSSRPTATSTASPKPSPDKE
jgi:hypothetical protein